MPHAQVSSAFSNAFDAKGRGRHRRGVAVPLPPPSIDYGDAYAPSGPRSRQPQTTVTTTTRGPAGMVPPPPTAGPPAADPRAQRRANFRASLDRDRERKQQGIDTRRAQLAASRGQMLPPPPGAGGSGVGMGGGPGAAVEPHHAAMIPAPNPYAEKYHESRIRQAKEKFDGLQADMKSMLPSERAGRASEIQKAQAELEAAYAAQQSFLMPPPPAAPTADPGVAQSTAPPAPPFVSQKARIDVSEQMAKTIYDNIVERTPQRDRTQAAEEFERTMAEYGRDGQALLRNWMNDGEPGSNPLGYDVHRTGGEERDVLAAPPPPPGPRRVLAGASGRAGLYDTAEGRVMVDANGHRVGGNLGPPAPAPSAPQQAGRQVELGPYSGFRPVPTGEQPSGGKYDPVAGKFRGRAMRPENRQTMQRATENAAGRAVVGQTAVNRTTGQRVRFNGKTWEPV